MIVYSGDYNLKGGCHSNVPVTMASEHCEKKFWAAQRQCHNQYFKLIKGGGPKSLPINVAQRMALGVSLLYTNL